MLENGQKAKDLLELQQLNISTSSGVLMKNRCRQQQAHQSAAVD